VCVCVCGCVYVCVCVCVCTCVCVCVRASKGTRAVEAPSNFSTLLQNVKGESEWLSE